jgi:predicted kinase
MPNVVARGPLVVLIGPPASGKSSWASRWFRRSEIVSSDALRRTICGDPNDQRATEHAMRARDAIIVGRMRFGLTTVVDYTSATAPQRKALAEMQFVASFRDEHRVAPAVAVIFDTPLDVCLARNAGRRGRRRVPDEFIQECDAAIQRDLPVASTWIPACFATGLRVDPDGTCWRMGGLARELDGLPWLDAARRLSDHPGWVGLPKREPAPPSGYARWSAAGRPG